VTRKHSSVKAYVNPSVAIEKAALGPQQVPTLTSASKCPAGRSSYKGNDAGAGCGHLLSDLMDERLKSRFAIYHPAFIPPHFHSGVGAAHSACLGATTARSTRSRATSTGESHEIAWVGPSVCDAEDIKPIVAAGVRPNSARVGCVFQVLVRAGRSSPDGETMLVPESWSSKR